MRAGTHFEIELSFFVQTTSSLIFKATSEAEALGFVKSNLQNNAELFVACLGDGVDHGNLVIEIDAQGQANVRAHEHRGFIARRVSKEQALNAFEYWLPSQMRTPDLLWSDE